MILTYNPELYEDFERIYTALILGYIAFKFGEFGMRAIDKSLEMLVSNEYKRKWKEKL